jgi:hypothetical protein
MNAGLDIGAPCADRHMKASIQKMFSDACIILYVELFEEFVLTDLKCAPMICVAFILNDFQGLNQEQLPFIENMSTRKHFRNCKTELVCP